MITVSFSLRRNYCYTCSLTITAEIDKKYESECEFGHRYVNKKFNEPYSTWNIFCMRLEGGFIWNYESKVQLNQSEIWAKASLDIWLLVSI
jgi:hypothetical protein